VRCYRPPKPVGRSSITGTLVRGTERISSNALLNLLEVGPDPVTRQKVAKRHKLRATLALAAKTLSCPCAPAPCSHTAWCRACSKVPPVPPAVFSLSCAAPMAQWDGTLAKLKQNSVAWHGDERTPEIHQRSHS
jgi:hypothetical protein